MLWNRNVLRYLANKISMLFYSEGNNSKMREISDKETKKTKKHGYFFMKNPYMKFQNISIHDSKFMLRTIKQQH